ncbi:hypothetical protein IGI37_001196 [Enterococcus sp. AZ194]|uniref:glycosyltransferase n=1 Tax=Enterococcus sp. AZ194 TaxID=2774629 RepID=UPI003F275E75
MMQPIISFILPIYNIDKDLLKQCLDCLSQFSRLTIEVIMIDDGSEMYIKDITKDYISDVRFYYFYQSNKGVSAARNAGLRQAQAEWVFFLDPDDLLSINSESVLLEGIKNNNNSDVIIFNYSELDNKTDKVYRTLHSETVIRSRWENLNSEELLLSVLRTPETNGVYSGYYLGMPWGKLIRRNFLSANSIEFPEDITKREDALFAVQMYSCMPKVSWEESVVYLYRINNNDSLSRKYTIELPNMFTKLLYKLLKFRDKVNNKEAFDKSFSLYCFELTKELVNLYFCNQNNTATYMDRRYAFLNFRRTEEFMIYFKSVPKFNGPFWKKLLFQAIKNESFYLLNVLYIFRKIRAIFKKGKRNDES